MDGMEWEAGDQKTKCAPLRYTVSGAAGTRKSFIIKTIFSYMKRMFDDSDVVRVVASIGMLSFNVPGKHYIYLRV
jgi:hypothetical protein